MLKKLLLTLSVTAVSLLYANDLSLLGIQTNNTYNVTPILVKKLQSKSKTKAYQKTRNTLKELQQYKNKVNQELENVSNNLQLPVQVSTQETNVVNGSISWSLVNNKCEINPQDVFQRSLANLVEKYKEIWDQLTTKGSNLWRLWAVNQTATAFCNALAKYKCGANMEYLNYVNKQKFQSDYKECLINSYKGMLKYSSGGKGGTNIVAAGYTSGTGWAPESNPSVFYIPCGGEGLPPCGMPFTLPKATHTQEFSIDPYAARAVSACYYATSSEMYNTGMDKCMKINSQKCLSFVNGKINLGIETELPQFKIAQESCILKHYQMNLNLQNLVVQGLKIETQNGKNAKVIFTNTALTSPNLINKVNVKVYNEYTSPALTQRVFQEYKNIKTRFNLSDSSFAYGLLSYLNFENWVDMLLGTPKTIEEYKKGSYDIKYIIGRWDFSNIEGLTRKQVGLVSFPTSIYQECMAVIRNSQSVTEKNVDNFFILMNSPAKDPFLYELQNAKKLAPGFSPKPYEGEILNGRNIFASTNYTPYSELIKIIGPKGIVNSYLKNGVPYYDILEIINMNNVCYSWANTLLTQYNKAILTEGRKLKTIEAEIAGADNIKKSEKKILKDKIQADLRYFKELVQDLDEIISLSQVNIKRLLRIKNYIYSHNNLGQPQIYFNFKK